MSQKVWLGISVLMLIPILMVFLSLTLSYSAHRWANIIVGAIHTAAVYFFVLAGTPPAPFAAFFAAIEIVCTLVIIGYAWKWRNAEAHHG